MLSRRTLLGQAAADRVRAYKPDPRAYRMAIDHFGLPREQIAFAAFGGWDAAGAKTFGYWTYWCNRLRTPVKVLGADPDVVSPDTADLLKHLG
jgi:2-haloacid dehalogenase